MFEVTKLNEKELIDKVNEFSKKAKEGTLTKEEEKDREIVRKEYIKRVTGSLIAHLDHIKK